jgi:hypothetical protein
MRNIILFFMIILITSCNQDRTKVKELELKERELELKERELALKEQNITNNETHSKSIDKKTKYKSYSPCTFTVSLPENYKMKAMFSDRSLDYCDYSVSTNDGFEVLELHSLINSRCGYSTKSNFMEENYINEAYNIEVKETKINISYKVQKDNWFVISGTRPGNGNIVYWKRVFGDNFVSDMCIEYPKSRESDIVPHIGKISRSFTSN